MPRLVSRGNGPPDHLADTGAHAPFMARPTGSRTDSTEGDLFRYRVVSTAEAALMAAALPQETRPDLFSISMSVLNPSLYRMDTRSTYDRPYEYRDDVSMAEPRSSEPLEGERPVEHTASQAERPRDGAGRDD